jgi:hypothetical protein
MKLFTQTFKLYAYKNYDICDLTLRVTDTFAITYRLTHEELQQIFTGAYDKPGVNVRLASGGKFYVVVKNSIDGVRFTITTHAGNFNLRYTIPDFESLIADYNNQMSMPVEWDSYDPR